MSEGIAIVIAAAIGIGGIVLSQFFTYLQRKDESNERFLYEVYPRRLALYEDVLRFFSKAAKRKITLNDPPVSADEIFEAVHDLEILLDRFALFGSLDSREPLDVLFKELVSMHNAVTAGLGEAERRNFNVFISRALKSFTEIIRGESGSNFVDKRLNKILKKKLPKKTSREKINNKPGRDDN